LLSSPAGNPPEPPNPFQKTLLGFGHNHGIKLFCYGWIGIGFNHLTNPSILIPQTIISQTQINTIEIMLMARFVPGDNGTYLLNSHSPAIGGKANSQSHSFNLITSASRIVVRLIC
jgi:hypothetical protein